MPQTIFLTRHWPAPAMEKMAQLGSLHLTGRDVPMSAAELADAFARFDIVCPTVSDHIDASIIAAGSGKVRLIANFGVGTEHIDLEACRAHGIRVTNTPDVLTEATAELAITLMLMVARRASEGERELRDGRWTGWRPTHLLGTGLRGKTLGLIGFGRIGQRTAEIAHHAFGMQILYHARREANDAAVASFWHPKLEAMLPQCDFLSLHVPGGPATRGLIGASALALLPPHAIVINTARGEVIDEAALAAALNTGQIAGAGLDVYANEPHISPALLAAPNLTLLPHLGSATLETRTAMGLRVAANVEAFLAGKALPNEVMPSVREG